MLVRNRLDTFLKLVPEICIKKHFVVQFDKHVFLHHLSMLNTNILFTKLYYYIFYKKKLQIKLNAFYYIYG